MTLRPAHGNSAAHGSTLVVEVLKADRLPEGVPVQAGPSNPNDRGTNGKFAPGNSLASAGGKARAGNTRLASKLGLSTLPEDARFRPYRASAASFRRAHCNELAKTVGGGFCSAGPSSLVASAALQLAMSRYFADLFAATENPEHALMASRLSNDSRQNLLAAHELAAREAKARLAASSADADAWNALTTGDPTE